MNKEEIKILIIEDDPDDIVMLQTLLENSAAPSVKMDFECRESLAEGIARLGQGGIDVVLLDLHLPDSKGVETFFRLHEQTPGVPAIILTALHDENLGVTAVQHGAQDYLVKGRIQGDLLLRALRFAIERQKIETELESLAIVDNLTGLYNRRGFLTLAEQQRKIARRKEHGLLLVFADLDGLKQINDTLGHAQGDRALIRTAEILKETFRASDVIARIGGDEFAVLAVDTEREYAGLLEQRIREKLTELNRRPSAAAAAVSLSVGIVYEDPQDTFSIESLMVKADECLYREKQSKRSPALDRAALPAERKAAGMEMDKQKKHLILLAEDDDDDYLLTHKALQEAGLAHDLCRVNNGEELMDYLLHRADYRDTFRFPAPSLILLDLNMPKKGGHEALKEIKSDPKLHKIPVVVLTTSRDEEDIHRAYELGANSFITKPGDFHQFMHKIQTVSHYWLNESRLPDHRQ